VRSSALAFSRMHDGHCHRPSETYTWVRFTVWHSPIGPATVGGLNDSTDLIEALHLNYLRACGVAMAYIVATGDGGDGLHTKQKRPNYLSSEALHWTSTCRIDQRSFHRTFAAILPLPSVLTITKANSLVLRAPLPLTHRYFPLDSRTASLDCYLTPR
jgi:hypothetical protein